jgi:hypothetical protein
MRFAAICGKPSRVKVRLERRNAGLTAPFLSAAQLHPPTPAAPHTAGFLLWHWLPACAARIASGWSTPLECSLRRPASNTRADELSTPCRTSLPVTLACRETTNASGKVPGGVAGHGTRVACSTHHNRPPRDSRARGFGQGCPKQQAGSLCSPISPSRS